MSNDDNSSTDEHLSCPYLGLARQRERLATPTTVTARSAPTIRAPRAKRLGVRSSSSRATPPIGSVVAVALGVLGGGVGETVAGGGVSVGASDVGVAVGVFVGVGVAAEGVPDAVAVGVYVRVAHGVPVTVGVFVGPPGVFVGPGVTGVLMQFGLPAE